MNTPLVFDGHNDTLLNLFLRERGKGRDFFEESERGHIDLPRAKRGGFGGGFFAIFAPSSPWGKIHSKGKRDPDAPFEAPLPHPLDLAYAQRMTTAMTANLFRIEAQSEGQVRVTRTVDEIEICLQNGTLATILHFEGAEAIDFELDALEVYYQAGLRSLGLVWSRPNLFAYGVPFKYGISPDIGPGLTEAGKRLVRECNRLGIMVDLSHLNEKGFWDVAAITEAPLVATHSNVHALCPITRNLTDKQLDAIKESDGMVGLNFHVAFLREDGRDDADTPLERMALHLDYLVERLGIDRVGFGSDFDGATVPRELRDVAGLPKLLDLLREHGYDDEALRKIAHENWLRVLRKTWKA